MNAEKKAKKKEAHKNKKEMKAAILDTTIAKDLEYVKTKHAHKHSEKES